MKYAMIALQGLAVHGTSGQQLSDAALPSHVVEQAFRWCSEAGVSCVAFLGDECATLRMTDDLEELHTRYERGWNNQLWGPKGTHAIGFKRYEEQASQVEGAVMVI